MYLRKYREASQAFSKGIENGSGNIHLYYERAVAERFLSQFDEAISDYTFFVNRIDPGILVSIKLPNSNKYV